MGCDSPFSPEQVSQSLEKPQINPSLIVPFHAVERLQSLASRNSCSSTIRAGASALPQIGRPAFDCQPRANSFCPVRRHTWSRRMMGTGRFDGLRSLSRAMSWPEGWPSFFHIGCAIMLVTSKICWKKQMVRSYTLGMSTTFNVGVHHHLS